MLVVEPAAGEDLMSVEKLAHDRLKSSVPRGSCCMVARDVDSDTLCGFAVARREDPCEGHILALAVDAAYEGQGIGGALLRSVSEKMHEAGAMHVHLDVRADNPRAQAFYARHGFAPEGLVPNAYDDGADAVRYGRGV